MSNEIGVLKIFICWAKSWFSTKQTSPTWNNKYTTSQLHPCYSFQCLLCSRWKRKMIMCLETQHRFVQINAWLSWKPHFFGRSAECSLLLTMVNDCFIFFPLSSSSLINELFMTRNSHSLPLIHVWIIIKVPWGFLRFKVFPKIKEMFKFSEISAHLFMGNKYHNNNTKSLFITN